MLSSATVPGGSCAQGRLQYFALIAPSVLSRLCLSKLGKKLFRGETKDER